MNLNQGRSLPPPTDQQRRSTQGLKKKTLTSISKDQLLNWVGLSFWRVKQSNSKHCLIANKIHKDLVDYLQYNTDENRCFEEHSSYCDLPVQSTYRKNEMKLPDKGLS